MYLWSLFTHGKVFQSLLWLDTLSPAMPSVQEPKKPSLPLQSCSPSRLHLFCRSNLWLADRVMLPGLKHLCHRGIKCSGHYADPESRTALCPRCLHMKKLTDVDAPGCLRWGGKSEGISHSLPVAMYEERPWSVFPQWQLYTHNCSNSHLSER